MFEEKSYVLPLYQMENGKVFKSPPPPRYRYPRLERLYIHKRSWHNKWGSVSRGGGQCHTRFLVLVERGWRWQDIKMLYFWLIYAQYKYSLNNTVILCVFLPFLVENYESYLIYVKKTHAPLPHFGPHQKFIKFEPGVKTCINCSRMNSSIIWYPLLYRTTPLISKNGDWKLCPTKLPVVAPFEPQVAHISRWR